MAQSIGVPVQDQHLVRRPAPIGEMQTYSMDEEVPRHPKIRQVFEDAIGRLNERVADSERVRLFDLVPHAFTIDGTN